MVYAMRSLRLVGPDSEGDAVVLESLDGAERFSLPLDERLRNVSLGQPPDDASVPEPHSEPVTPGEALSPREIQTRVRAGESAQAVADKAGVPVEKVMRFALPVLAERSRVVDEARRARARHGSEGSLSPFGELIDDRLGRHGVNPAAVGWDAFRRPDGGWTVVAAFTAAEQNRTAKFSFALHNRTVSALDALAADLLSGHPVRALLPPDPEPVTELTPPAAVRLTAVPDHPDDEPSDLPLATTAPLRPARRQRTRTRPIPIDADDELFDQEAVEDAPATGWQEPPLPLELPTEVGQHAAADADDEAANRRVRRGEKPRMPSWDDILFGVKHRTD